MNSKIMNLMFMIMAMILSQQVMGNRLLSLNGLGGRRKLNISSSAVGEEVEEVLLVNPCRFEQEKVNQYNRIRLVGIQAFVENNGLVDDNTILQFTDCALLSNDYTMIQSLGGGRDYFYYAKSWGECGGNCTSAKQKREVLCFSTITKEVVEDSSCEALEKPKSEQNCRLPCREARRHLQPKNGSEVFETTEAAHHEDSHRGTDAGAMLDTAMNPQLLGGNLGGDGEELPMGGIHLLEALEDGEDVASPWWLMNGGEADLRDDTLMAGDMLEDPWMLMNGGETDLRNEALMADDMLEDVPENGGVSSLTDAGMAGVSSLIAPNINLLDEEDRMNFMMQAVAQDMTNEDIMENGGLGIMMHMMGGGDSAAAAGNTETGDYVQSARDMIDAEMMAQGFLPNLNIMDPASLDDIDNVDADWWSTLVQNQLEEEGEDNFNPYAGMNAMKGENESKDNVIDADWWSTLVQNQLEESEDNFNPYAGMNAVKVEHKLEEYEMMNDGFVGADSRRNLLEAPESIFVVQSVSDNDCDLPDDLAESLQTNGFTKIVCVFDILIGGQSDFSDVLLIYTANTLAEILDQDQDGNVDDPTVVAALTYKGENAPNVWIAGGNTRETENRCEIVFPATYCFGLQTYHAEIPEFKAQIATEEVFHMVHHYGWSEAYPEALGVNDFTTSIACREMARLECSNPGWWHPENDCPRGGSDEPITPPLLGTCNTPDCDCVEFYHQASLMMIGQQPGWLSPFMPTTQQGMLDLLSTEFKDMVRNPAYHQLKKPLTYVYNPSRNSEATDIDCVGYWTPCDSGCTSVYFVETTQRGAGAACQYEDLDTRKCSPGMDFCPIDPEAQLQDTLPAGGESRRTLSNRVGHQFQRSDSLRDDIVHL